MGPTEFTFTAELNDKIVKFLKKIVTNHWTLTISLNSTIIGTVLDHFQPNQMTQIGLGVQKVCFCNFFRFLLSVGVKKEPKKIKIFFLIFLAQNRKKKSQKKNYFQKFLNPLRSGPFQALLAQNRDKGDTPLVYNTITAFLLSYFIIIQKKCSQSESGPSQFLTD